MKDKQTRICPISKLPLPIWMHGNKKYHPDAEKLAKEMNNERRYNRIRNLVNLAIRLDDILAKHYPHSAEVAAINKDLLVRDGFAWDFNSAMTLLADNSPVFWILDYGFSFADKKGNLIIIYHGKSPIQQSEPASGNAEEQ